MARHNNQKLTPGAPEKPDNLSPRASAAWDRIVGELTASNIQVSPAHRALISLAATTAADIAEAWETVQEEGTYITNAKTGGVQAHPASKRLDMLRRDYVKVMSLIGLRAAVNGGSVEGPTLTDLLNG